jgi:hypothetical protein
VLVGVIKNYGAHGRLLLQEFTQAYLPVFTYCHRHLPPKMLELLQRLDAEGGGRFGGAGKAEAAGAAAVATAQNSGLLTLATQFLHQPRNMRRFAGATYP